MASSWLTLFYEPIIDYNEHATNHYESSKETLKVQYNTALRPYRAREDHIFSLLYPLSNSVHCLLSAARILKGVLSLGYALFTEPKTSPLVFFGMAQEIGSLLINLVTIVASIVNFVTKTFATIFNLGYAPKAMRSLTDENASRSRTSCGELKSAADGFLNSCNELKRVQEEQNLGQLSIFRVQGSCNPAL